MWFKNLYIYEFQKEPAMAAEDFEAALTAKRFAPRPPTQWSSMGWTQPLGDASKALSHKVGCCTLISLEIEEAILPKKVISSQLRTAVKRISEAENRVIPNQEKKAMREDIENELLPKAFSARTRIDAWIDQTRGQLVIDTPSSAKAEAFATMLRKTLGSLPVEPIGMSDGSLMSLLSGWMTHEGIPHPKFTFGDSVALENAGEEGGKVSYTDHDIPAAEIKANLDAGKQVSALSITYDDRLSFSLTHLYQLKKLKFLDIVAERMLEEDPQTIAEERDIQFSIMTGEVGDMLVDLVALTKTN